MRRILLAIVGLAALGIGLGSARPTRVEPGTLRTVAIVGDSVARGAGDESGLGIGGYLPDVAVSNLAINGARTANILLHLRRAPVASQLRRADAVIISIGGNDLFGDPAARIVSTFAPELAIRRTSWRVERVVAAVRRLNPAGRIYLLGLYNPYRAAWLDPLVSRWDSRIIRSFAGIPGVTVIRVADLFERPGMLSPIDRFHPSAVGYRAIAERIAASW